MTTVHRHTLDRFFSGTIDEKMAEMNELYEHHGVQLLADTANTDSLELLSEYAAELSGQMDAMNLGRLCCNCAGKTGGGCCSSYMEANSDVLLLLMNRLSGTTISRQHTNGNECCFLGSSGCILPIKPMFCLNYNCSHIHNQASQAEMNELERLAGRVLTEQTRLETILLHTLGGTACTILP